MTEPVSRALARQQRNAERLEAAHLYSPEHERDACGVGFVAAIDGKPRRDVVLHAIQALKCVWHRGAVDADGKTGDGAGIHVQVPRAFFEEEVRATGHALRKGHIGIGMIFLPRTDYAAQEMCRTLVEAELLRQGCYIYGWRQVPIDVSVIGEKANITRPEIEQIMFDAGEGGDIDTVERDLFVVRRRIEQQARAAAIENFYICSLSTRSLIYKGMFLAEQLSNFYPDLLDDRFVSAMAIFHQRYSTNTFPSWRAAQPFRMLAHNGEINTLKGNINWMKSHEIRMASEALGERAADIKPIIQPGSSDSAALDAVFEVLCRAGRSAPMAKTLLIPEAWSKQSSAMPEAHRAMYAYSNSVMEPWDGPAALACTDGRWVIAGLDRNGLRPLRYAVASDGLLFVGSEAGMVQIPEQKVLKKGRVGPGQMIGVNLERGELLDDRQIKDELARKHPYEKWTSGLVELDPIIGPGPEPLMFEDRDELRRRQLAAGISIEDLEMVLHPMVEDSKEPVGSMGDDVPLAVLSQRYRPLSHFFRQDFSQVTNPPIDSLREDRVMSLRTRFRNLGNVLAQDQSQVEVFTLESPVISTGMFERLKEHLTGRFEEIDCLFEVGPEGAADGALKAALDRICKQAEEAVRSGTSHLVLTDERIHEAAAAIPMILATGAVHTHLVKNGLRTFTSINVRSAECMDTHYFAVLIGVGATTVNAYLAQECIAQRHARGLFGSRSLGECVKRYLDCVDQGLLKIISKMGISVISSYRGAYNFEALGLSRAMVAEYFPGMASRISGIGLSGVQRRAAEIHRRAFNDDAIALPIGGFYKLRKSGETHAHSAETIHALQEAVARESFQAFKKYSTMIWEAPPTSLRHLMEFRRRDLKPIPIEEVESITEIRKRFVTPGMSLGALSPEAHRTLNIAMNRIGAKSDSGEGGENPAHYAPAPNGDNANSAIKQVASGRFGVTAEYLNQCREIEIKIAQGAKPGEGGQLPGFKVTDEIARFRHSTPGVMLISPPPHHDIYSIEDLAQLIYDLKQINPDARVGVKLVARSGIGAIAAGVAKAKADVILISGHVGGTGASPLTSIKHAGVPWELGLTEAHQVLTLNNLRHRVVLRTDGGLRTGRDIVMAAMMGAEEYGIGTAALVAMGCIMVRQCHSNTCPVGVCTQDEKLREKFSGSAEKVVNLMSFIAEEVREILAELGFRSLRDVIGRTDLLGQIHRGAQDLDDLDLNPLLVQADPGPNPRYCTLEGRNEVPDSLDLEIVRDAKRFLEDGEKMQLTYSVRNTMRAIGTRVSSHIVRRYGMKGLSPGQLTIELRGAAGQSLGAFAVQGLKLKLLGEANDYVGKGLSGATIVVRPMASSTLESSENVIIGNTVLYGATAGRLFAAGQAGDRFAVRNSGAVTVVEGCGSNGVEYMTGGLAVILGPVGENFAAGMTGGMAFVLDDDLSAKLNPASVISEPLGSQYWEEVLRKLIEEHEAETGSKHAARILADWANESARFWCVCPKETLARLKHPLRDEGRVGRLAPRAKARAAPKA